MTNFSAKTIVCLVASLSQPRCIKRIMSLRDAGYVVIVYGYDRNTYNINTYPKDMEVYNLGFAKNGLDYFSKFIKKWKHLRVIFKKYKKENNILYYAFSFDLALITYLLSNHRYMYEISDLVYGYFKNEFIRGIFKRIDKVICKRSMLTVMTSGGFKNYLFRVKSIDNLIIQPNKVNQSLLLNKRFSINLKESTSINFAYVGAFRYPNTIFRFAKIIGERYPKHKFFFYGESDLTYLAKEYSEKYDNVYHSGEFKNPDDLEEIYSNIHVIVACYDIDTLNERVAEPNKFYEAMCFCKPIIVSKNTFLSNQVECLSVGYSIDASCDDFIDDFIKNISYTDLNKKSQIELMLSRENYTDDPQILIDTLEKKWCWGNNL